MKSAWVELRRYRSTRFPLHVFGTLAVLLCLCAGTMSLASSVIRSFNAETQRTQRMRGEELSLTAAAPSTSADFRELSPSATAPSPSLELHPDLCDSSASPRQESLNSRFLPQTDTRHHES